MPDVCHFAPPLPPTLPHTSSRALANCTNADLQHGAIVIEEMYLG